MIVAITIILCFPVSRELWEDSISEINKVIIKEIRTMIATGLYMSIKPKMIPANMDNMYFIAVLSFKFSKIVKKRMQTKGKSITNPEVKSL